MKELEGLIRKKFDEAEDKFAFMNELKELLYSISPEKENPVERVLWIPKEMVVANNYNPNSVAAKEMRLLYTSVKEDGYTQPIVTYRDENLGKYVIVDGFHRNLILRKFKDIEERCHGRLPIVVIDKGIDDRMASTIRHNRARGSHSVDGMANILYSMVKDGKSEKEICDKLGLEQREFVKMMHITGFAKMFKDYKFSRAIDTIVFSDELVKKAENEDKIS